MLLCRYEGGLVCAYLGFDYEDTLNSTSYHLLLHITWHYWVIFMTRRGESQDRATVRQIVQDLAHETALQRTAALRVMR